MIEAIIRGDEFAFEQAYVQHRGKVYSYFLRKTKSQEDAADLMQTVFLKLWQYRSSLSREYLLEQHLFSIARTVFIDYLRRENKKAAIEDSLLRKTTAPQADQSTSPAFDLRRQMGSALSTMPETRKKVFELSRLQGYSYQEIAEHLSISVKAVDNNLTKALRQLRKAVWSVAILYLIFC